MLVLRRKRGEAITISQVITVRVLEIEGDRVKLGIDAPPDVLVLREELADNLGNANMPLPTTKGVIPA